MRSVLVILAAPPAWPPLLLRRQRERELDEAIWEEPRQV